MKVIQVTVTGSQLAQLVCTDIQGYLSRRQYRGRMTVVKYLQQIKNQQRHISPWVFTAAMHLMHHRGIHPMAMQKTVEDFLQDLKQETKSSIVSDVNYLLQDICKEFNDFVSNYKGSNIEGAVRFLADVSAKASVLPYLVDDPVRYLVRMVEFKTDPEITDMLKEIDDVDRKEKAVSSSTTEISRTISQITSKISSIDAQLESLEKEKEVLRRDRETLENQAMVLTKAMKIIKDNA